MLTFCLFARSTFACQDILFRMGGLIHINMTFAEENKTACSFEDLVMGAGPTADPALYQEALYQVLYPRHYLLQIIGPLNGRSFTIRSALEGTPNIAMTLPDSILNSSWPDVCLGPQGFILHAGAWKKPLSTLFKDAYWRSEVMMQVSSLPCWVAAIALSRAAMTGNAYTWRRERQYGLHRVLEENHFRTHELVRDMFALLMGNSLTSRGSMASDYADLRRSEAGVKEASWCHDPAAVRSWGDEAVKAVQAELTERESDNPLPVSAIVGDLLIVFSGKTGTHAGLVATEFSLNSVGMKRIFMKTLDGCGVVQTKTMIKLREYGRRSVEKGKLVAPMKLVLVSVPRVNQFLAHLLLYRLDAGPKAFLLLDDNIYGARIMTLEVELTGEDLEAEAWTLVVAEVLLLGDLHDQNLIRGKVVDFDFNRDPRLNGTVMAKLASFMPAARVHHLNEISKLGKIDVNEYIVRHEKGEWKMHLADTGREQGPGEANGDAMANWKRVTDDLFANFGTMLATDGLATQLGMMCHQRDDRACSDDFLEGIEIRMETYKEMIQGSVRMTVEKEKSERAFAAARVEKEKSERAFAAAEFEKEVLERRLAAAERASRMAIGAVIGMATGAAVGAAVGAGVVAGIGAVIFALIGVAIGALIGQEIVVNATGFADDT
jgi:hypothetical protein